ncbi:MAG: tRNA pseudouridine(38-40) synthase TruA, partial [Desulfamplus sp.]|nr:tRNA pseudouridine(38-40) synthase TruA [Desulfamplus sp.]
MEYDGTPFSGWQIQDGRTTIQGELEKKLSIILNQSVKITGSGRTDAGVHALGQAANFTAFTGISPDELKKGINSMLKGPIVIHTCEEADPDFHARYSAISKE